MEEGLSRNAVFSGDRVFGPVRGSLAAKIGPFREFSSARRGPIFARRHGVNENLRKMGNPHRINRFVR
jgi:hypothetical protein